MSSSDDSFGNTNRSFSLFDAPYTWIFTPLIIFFAGGILITLIQFRRRRRRRRFNPERSWPRSTVEASHQGQSRQASLRRSRWTSTTRTDEGLDEFGEAPPAYEPKAKPGLSLARNDSFDVAHVPYPELATPPLSAHTTDGNRFTLPPDYRTAISSAPPSPRDIVANPPSALTRN